MKISHKGALLLLLVSSCGGKDSSGSAGFSDPEDPGTTSAEAGINSDANDSAVVVENIDGHQIDALDTNNSSSDSNISSAGCEGKMCGEECTSDQNGKRYCDINLQCVHGAIRSECFYVPDGGVQDCKAMDANGLTPDSTCRMIFGWTWNGNKCDAVVGCSCSGADCQNLFYDALSCDFAYRNCK